MKRLSLTLVGLLLAAEAGAQNGEWEVGASTENLTQGKAPWHSMYLNGKWRSPGQWVAFGGLRETERYDLRDEEIHLGANLPLPGGPRLEIEMGHSPTHRVLPSNYASMRIETELAKGWLGAAGWRRSAYDSGMTSVGHLALEHYFGNQRAGYTLYEGRPDGSGFAASHRLHWAWHYGGDERNWLGAAAISGRETEHVVPSGFLTARVHAVQLSGLHWISRDWAVSWEAGQTRQGDYYTRRGLHLGLRHAF